MLYTIMIFSYDTLRLVMFLPVENPKCVPEQERNGQSKMIQWWRNKQEDGLHEYARGNEIMEGMPHLPLSQAPSEELINQIHHIGKTRSASELLPFFTDIVKTTQAHPAFIGIVLDTLDQKLTIKGNREPLARYLEAFFVQIEPYLQDDSLNGTVKKPFLSLTQTLIEDSYQVCIGFQNAPMGHRYVDTQPIKQALQEKNPHAIVQQLVEFWQYDNEFAPDKDIQAAYHLFQNLGEEHSEHPELPLPIGFEDAFAAFDRIEKTGGTILLRDRQAIAHFYEKNKPPIIYERVKPT